MMKELFGLVERPMKRTRVEAQRAHRPAAIQSEHRSSAEAPVRRARRARDGSHSRM
jgi:hypothetical protein